MKKEGETRQKLLTVRAHSGSREAKVEKLGEGEYKVHVLAPPEKGQANREVIIALAEHLGLPASRLRIVRGERSRLKWIALEPGR